MKRMLLLSLTLVLITALTVGVFASTRDTQETLSYRDISITLNGAVLEPKNAQGEAVEPFIIDGTTYLPVRAIAEALDLDVAWDGEHNTVVLTTPESTNAPAPELESADAPESEATPEPESADAPESGTTRTVSYTSTVGSVSLELPDDWDYTIHPKEELDMEDGLILWYIDLYPKADPDFVIELGEHYEFGICGTGVTMETVDVANGLQATKCTEEIGDELWFYFIYDIGRTYRESFVARGDFPTTLWNSYESQVIDILRTVQITLPEASAN